MTSVPITSTSTTTSDNIFATGLAFAGGAVLATAHDYRVKDSKRGWICLNGVDIHIVIPEATFRTSRFAILCLYKVSEIKVI